MPMATRLGKPVTCHKGFQLCYSTLWSYVLARLRDKLKSSYLCYHNTYGHKTRKDDDLP